MAKHHTVVDLGRVHVDADYLGELVAPVKAARARQAWKPGTKSLMRHRWRYLLLRTAHCSQILQPRTFLLKSRGRMKLHQHAAAAAAKEDKRSSTDLELDALRSQNLAMRQELDLLRDAFERIPHGMCAFDSNDTLVLANAHYRKIWNLPPEVVRPGVTFRQIMDATPGRESIASLERPQPLAGSEGMRWREWQLEDGRIVEIAVSRLADGSCVALHEDVTDQRKAQERISFMARHDLLTGLPNRGVLREELERGLAATCCGGTVALLCLDLDRFKPVNDTFGHGAGDALLKQVAERLRGCAGETDIVARVGGDEFAVVQRDAVQPKGSDHLARRIIDVLTRPFDVDGHVVHIGTSVGIAVVPSDGGDSETLLRQGDLALYRAKSDGRGQMRYFEASMNEGSVAVSRCS